MVAVSFVLAIEGRTAAEKPDEVEQGDRSCDWMISDVHCNVDKNAAISDAMSRLNFLCALLHDPLPFKPYALSLEPAVCGYPCTLSLTSIIPMKIQSDPIPRQSASRRDLFTPV